MTQQCPLFSVVKSRRLSLFGDVTQVTELADANRILFAQPLDNWRRPPGGHTPPGFEMFLQQPVLIWHGAARSQGGSSELTFLADVNEA